MATNGSKVLHDCSDGTNTKHNNTIYNASGQKWNTYMANKGDWLLQE